MIEAAAGSDEGLGIRPSDRGHGRGPEGRAGGRRPAVRAAPPSLHARADGLEPRASTNWPETSGPTPVAGDTGRRRDDQSSPATTSPACHPSGCCATDARCRSSFSISLAIETAVASGRTPIAEIGWEAHLVEAGGLGRRLCLFRLPDANPHTATRFERRVPVRGRGDTRLFVCVTLEDGYQAWSSRVYLFPSVDERPPVALNRRSSLGSETVAVVLHRPSAPRGLSRRRGRRREPPNFHRPRLERERSGESSRPSTREANKWTISVPGPARRPAV
jgi:hypothetical protein